MKRLAALVGAVVLVAAAFAVRDRTGGDDGGGPAAGSDPGVVCAPDYAEACEGAAIETPGDTARRLIDATSADALGAAAWIVPAGWAEMVVEERSRTGKPALWTIDPEPLASSVVVVAIWADRAAELARRCGGDVASEAVGWSCLSSQAGDRLPEGDRVRVGSPPVDSATGPMIAATQAASVLGTADFAANDFDASFRAAVEPLAAGQIDDALGRMRSRGPGEITAVGLIAAHARRVDSTFGTILVAAVEPRVRVDMVALVPAGDRLATGVRARVGGALVDAGWDRPTDDGPADDGLPPGGVLAAIRTVWDELG